MDGIELDEEEQRQRMEVREYIKEQEQEEDSIEESKIRKAVKRMKMKMAAGIDGSRRRHGKEEGYRTN